VKYAVVWSENGGPLYAGRLELADRCVRLAGRAGQAWESDRALFYEELAGVRVERRLQARLSGRPTLVLERRNGGGLRIASVEGPGSLHELAERLEAARGKAGA
jgi:hypothetical protein